MFSVLVGASAFCKQRKATQDSKLTILVERDLKLLLQRHHDLHLRWGIASFWTALAVPQADSERPCFTVSSESAPRSTNLASGATCAVHATWLMEEGREACRRLLQQAWLQSLCVGCNGRRPTLSRSVPSCVEMIARTSSSTLDLSWGAVGVAQLGRPTQLKKCHRLARRPTTAKQRTTRVRDARGRTACAERHERPRLQAPGAQIAVAPGPHLSLGREGLGAHEGLHGNCRQQGLWREDCMP